TISSYGAENVFNAATSQYTSVSALDSTHFVASYMDAGNSSYGTAIVGLTSGTGISSYGNKNALTPRFLVLGIASASKTNGQTVSVIVSGVSAVHSGLAIGAIYYANTDGSLTTSAGNTQIGLAVSSTSILLNTVRAHNYNFADIAEEYLVEGEGEPGDIVSISSTSTEQNPTVARSTSAYQTNIIGIISTNPAIVIGQLQQGNHQPVALTGLESFDCSMALPTMKQCSNETMKQCSNATMKQCDNGVSRILVFVSVGFADPYGALTLNSLGTVGTASNSPAPTSVIDYIISDIQAGLRKLGVYVQEGILQVSKIVVNEITSKKVITDELCIGSTCVTEQKLQELLQKDIGNKGNNAEEKIDEH
ncbi:MAG: DUF2190 family protein, partial [Candidatus Spechtbacteria bacterium]|nr:DUF2190 family protein [Candidatus Spechtbacteria bacterium]